MTTQRWEIFGLSVAAALALWLLLAGPDQVLGLDSGHAGMVLLVNVTWISLYRISRMPPGKLDAAVSPGEWRAWLGLGVTLVAVVYFVANAQLLGTGPAWANPAARAVATNLVLLLIAWTVLSRVMGSRWKGVVQRDERDREIEVKAGAWGSAALVFGMIGFAGMLGFSPPQKLQWATHFMIANLLVLALMWSWLCEYAATVALYWYDRR